MASPLTITIFDKAFTRVGFIGNPARVELHLRHNALPTGTIEVASDHPYRDRLLADGARLTIDYAGVQVMSGPVRGEASKAGKDSNLVLTIEDDWRLLSRMLGWPNPTGDQTQQGLDDKTYDRKTGPAETVVKWFVSRNATRLGLPVTVAPDLGRGSTVTAKMRMDKQDDQLLPLIASAGIGVTIRQVGAGFRVDCYEPAWYPITLTPESGVVADWDWSKTGAKATRVVVGGGGIGPNRDFRTYVDAALEASTGDVIEVFVDASDAYSDTKTAYDKWQTALTNYTTALNVKDRALADQSNAQHRYDIASDNLDTANYLLSQNPTNQGAKDRVTAATSRKTEMQNLLTAANTTASTATTSANTADAARVTAENAYNAARTMYLADLDARGAQALADGAPATSLKLALSETDTFRYGSTLRVGDLVTTQLIPGSSPITSPLSEAVLSWDVQNGFVATPVVGDRNDDPNRIFARAIASVARAVRIDRAGR